MKRLYLFAMALLGALAFVGCETEDPMGGDNEALHERIIFTLLNAQEPIVAAPDEEVVYKFKISYSQGIASVHTSLNGEVIEGSEVNYLNAPALVEAPPEEGDTATTPEGDETAIPSVEYTFNYTVKGSQFGETLDFVFTAVGADGYTQSVDYALWISSNAVEFIVNKTGTLPESIYSDHTVNFDIKIECGNFLKTFDIFKNDVAYDSVAESALAEMKTYTYHFTYTPTAEDIGTTVSFHFVATDVKGNLAETFYDVAVVKADAVGKMLWSESFNTSMSISTTTAFDTIEGGITSNAKTEFVAGNIARYATLFSEGNDGEQVPNVGAMEGCEVYDGDKSAIKYTSDGTDVCLSKFEEAADAQKETKFMTGGYLWYRKAKGGWFRVDGIKLHGVTSLKLTYAQSAQKIKVDYSLDGGETWVEIGTTEGAAETQEHKFIVTEGSETISLKFSENDGTSHVRIDNLKLVEVL